MRQLPVFISGNAHKSAYLERQLGVRIERVSIDLDELQSLDLHKIVAHKLKQAYVVTKRPVLVEDVSLVYTALGELPGPFIKWFIANNGAGRCCRLLDGYSDRSAVIRCTFGYYDGNDMTFFDSEIPGSISDHPRGSNGFGFDSFFIMEGDTRTRAEMSQEEVETTYATHMKPFSQLRDFLTK